MIAVPNFPIQIQALGCLAFAGDLGMGQPVDHSPRTALLAYRISEIVTNNAKMSAMSVTLALLRWAGCTANAREFSDLFGDDIAGRAAFIENRNPFLGAKSPTEKIGALLQPLALAHCEAVAEIAEQLGFPPEIGFAALDFFENWDGYGLPNGKRKEHISLLAQIVRIAGELEVLARVYGLDKALQILETHAGTHHDPALYVLLRHNASRWIVEIEQLSPWQEAALIACGVANDIKPTIESIVILLADHSDLKAPADFRLSRRAAFIGSQIAEAANLPLMTMETVRLGALLHGLGRSAVPNATLERKSPLSESDVEYMRLVPYWTGRILRRAPALNNEAALAMNAFERLDGSGYPRGLGGGDNSPAMRIVQTSVKIATLEASTIDLDSIRVIVERDVNEGRLDRLFAFAGLSVLGFKKIGEFEHLQYHGSAALTEREKDVLTNLARGLSNKEIARALGISPKTAGSHVENIYRKLGVNSRAAAALKAVRWHLVEPI
jgi:HD-GYP domain-containing protein (c-di-GMP phosphodiesterase class II)/DNA-binding CsgD family transcriptional regulator